MEYSTDNKKSKATGIDHIMYRNCLLKHVIEGVIKGGRHVMGRRGRRPKQLLDDLIETKLKLEIKKESSSSR